MIFCDFHDFCDFLWFIHYLYQQQFVIVNNALPCSKRCSFCSAGNIFFLGGGGGVCCAGRGKGEALTTVPSLFCNSVAWFSLPCTAPNGFPFYPKRRIFCHELLYWGGGGGGVEWPLVALAVPVVDMQTWCLMGISSKGSSNRSSSSSLRSRSSPVLVEFWSFLCNIISVNSEKQKTLNFLNVPLY